MSVRKHLCAGKNHTCDREGVWRISWTENRSGYPGMGVVQEQNSCKTHLSALVEEFTARYDNVYRRVSVCPVASRDFLYADGSWGPEDADESMGEAA